MTLTTLDNNNLNFLYLKAKSSDITGDILSDYLAAIISTCEQNGMSEEQRIFQEYLQEFEEQRNSEQ